MTTAKKRTSAVEPTVNIWRIATDTREYKADDWTGAGAKATGGRWNRKGTPMLYCAESVALACLETLVHLKAGGLPLNRYVIRIEVPDSIWVAAKILDVSVYAGWDAIPYGLVSEEAGEHWIATGESLLYKVPSVVVPQETNILVNPLHPDMKQITFHKSPTRWTYDSRLK